MGDGTGSLDKSLPVVLPPSDALDEDLVVGPDASLVLSLLLLLVLSISTIFSTVSSIFCPILLIKSTSLRTLLEGNGRASINSSALLLLVVWLLLSVEVISIGVTASLIVNVGGVGGAAAAANVGDAGGGDLEIVVVVGGETTGTGVVAVVVVVVVMDSSFLGVIVISTGNGSSCLKLEEEDDDDEVSLRGDDGTSLWLTKGEKLLRDMIDFSHLS